MEKFSSLALVACILWSAPTGSEVGNRIDQDPPEPTEASKGSTLGGSALFGFAVTAIHDFDGDGVRDLLVGAPGCKKPYRCYVSSGKDGTVLQTVVLADAMAERYKVERFGIRGLALPDLDGDSIPEIAILARCEGGLVLFVLGGMGMEVIKVIQGWNGGTVPDLGPPAGVRCNGEEAISMVWLPSWVGAKQGRVVLGCPTSFLGSGRDPAQYLVQWSALPGPGEVHAQRVGLAASMSRQALCVVGGVSEEGSVDLAIGGLRDTGGNGVLCFMSGKDMGPIRWVMFEPEIFPAIEGLSVIDFAEGILLCFGAATPWSQDPRGNVLGARFWTYSTRSWEFLEVWGGGLKEASKQTFGTDVFPVNGLAGPDDAPLIVSWPFGNKVKRVSVSGDEASLTAVMPPDRPGDFGNQAVKLLDLNDDGYPDYAVTSNCRGFAPGVVDVFSGLDDSLLFRVQSP